MNRRTYDAALLLGVLLASGGAGLQWGAGLALLVAGGLVIGLTLFGAAVTASKG